jgi:lipopolysaccharide assembly outer membrane protein LptD (OstA)
LFHDSSFLYCDSARIEGLVVKAYGKVVIRHNDTVQIFADSLRYDGKAKATDLFGEVILISGGQSLYTRRLHYELDSSIASYNTPATLRTKQTVLKSKRGYYHVRKDKAYFYGNVQLSDPEIQLRSDSWSSIQRPRRLFLLLLHSWKKGNGKFIAKVVIMMSMIK